jgi:radical SAM protein with 4Fe4S-binding SPASM domain
MTSCQALYASLAVLWNGDVVTCCMDWRRDNVMGSVRDASIREVWEGRQYQAIRALSDTGRLNERPLCLGCGHNRFSINSGDLRNRLSSAAADSPEDLELLGTLDSLREQSSQLIQLGLMQ